MNLPGMPVPVPGRPLYLQNSPSPGKWPTYGLAMRFKVTIKDSGTSGISDLGMWSACRGLKVQFATTTIKVGGIYEYEEFLPDQIKFSNVTLERGVLKKDSKNVQKWLKDVAKHWRDGDYKLADITIKLYDATDDDGAIEWKLKDAFPVSWTGPSMAASENKIAMETLELAHRGFLDV